MDAKVNDFFKEINEIVPPVAQIRSTSDCVWQECFDDTSGYPYYWNMLSNEVTWEIPPDYQAWLDKSKVSKTKRTDSADTAKPLFPSAIKSSITLGESKTISASKACDVMGACQDVKKIKVLPAYLIDSDHDSREGHCLSRNGSNTNSPLHSNNSNKSNSRAGSDVEAPDEIKPTLGFSLLANYGNYSDEEDSQDEQTPADNSPRTAKCEAVSTLFPVTQPIDVKQFAQEAHDRVSPTVTEEIDAKAFKRKRRIGVHLVNRPKKGAIDEEKDGRESAESERKKFGMTFVKGETLQPTLASASTTSGDGEADVGDTVVETQTTLKEKLAFLSEGRQPISPVQIMSIQLEILFIAWKAGSLDSSYFSTWIKDMSSDLIKLEEDATPAGWHLEWDRQEKRYFYRNKATDECQWDYPRESRSVEEGKQDGSGKPDDVDEDDAMDICTTPPPTDAAADGCNIEVTTICAAATDDAHKDEASNSKQHDLSSALDSFYSDIAAIETASDAHQQESLDETKTTSSSEVPTNGVQVIAEIAAHASTVEPAKKRRKVKMSHGISMKKKGVSKLVEKWKNVQKNLD